MGTSRILLIIAVVAVVTFITRALPFWIFGRGKEVPKPVAYIGNVLPPTVMAVLIIYCLKGVRITAYPYGLPQIIGVAVVVFLHIWKRNNLLSIAGGTICYMLLVQFVFV